MIGSARFSGEGQRAGKRATLLAIVGALFALILATVALVRIVAGTRGGAAPAAESGSRAPLAIFPFDNQTGDSKLDWYGNGAAEWLSVDLAKLPNVSVISSHRLLEAARSLKLDAKSLDSARAAQIAGHARARYLLRGATLKLGAEMFVKAEVIEVASGKVIAAQQVAGVTEKNLTEKLGELAGLLRRELQRLK